MAIREMTKKAAVAGLAVAGAGVVCTGALAACAVAGYRKRPRGLHGKVVLITGSSRGLGLAMAEEFGRQGAKLALTARDIHELERARGLLLKRLRTDAEEIFVVSGDLRDPEEAERVVQDVTARFGRIDILVNNAGIITVGPVESQSLEDFRNVMNANFFSGLHCTLGVLPQMLARGHGNIVNITSIGGKIAVPHMLPYTASKFAAVGLSEGLNTELRSKGIQVTTVCPGLMRTGSHLNAVFTGDAAREYRWFSLSAGLPLVSTSARAAARKIVRATASGKREIAISPQAIVAARLGNVCPTFTMGLMQAMNSVLPHSGYGRTAKHRGAESRDLEVKPAMGLAQAAARRYNQAR